MCVSISQADFEKTIIMVNEPDPNVMGMQVHTMLYQNNRTNFGGLNAMILHIDTQMPMGPQNFISTTEFPLIANDMVLALQPQTRSGEASGSYEMTRAVQIFDVGSYTVVVAEDAREIALVVSRIPENKRPALNHQLFDFYAQAYPGRSVALCCFDSSAQDTEPMMFWWQPRDPSRFIMPALDEHTGNVPVPGAPVEVDHWLITGSYQMSGGVPVNYRQRNSIPQEVLNLLPSKVAGCHATGQWPNGDFVIDTQKVYEASPQGQLNPRQFDRLIPN